MLCRKGRRPRRIVANPRFRREIGQLKRLLADKTVEVDFFRGALQKVEARRRRNDVAGEKASTRKFETPLQGSLSIERMCQLAQVSRAGFYRFSSEPGSVGRGHDDAIYYSGDCPGTSSTLWLSAGHCGTATARDDGEPQTRVANDAGGQPVDDPRNRELESVTDADRESEIYLNLSSRMKVSGPNQLWIADITYIRLKAEFVYLAVLLDAFSRKVVGWALDRSLQAKLPLNSLELAIANRQPPPGLVHHSDRGVQYACRDYIQTLRSHRIIPSMSRPGNPYDNASCESFMKTLKREEIHANDYGDLEHAAQSIEAFIEHYYNRCRLHSALGYRPPEEFEGNSGQRDAEADLAASRVTLFAR